MSVWERWDRWTDGQIGRRVWIEGSGLWTNLLTAWPYDRITKSYIFHAHRCHDCHFCEEIWLRLRAYLHPHLRHVHLVVYYDVYDDHFAVVTGDWWLVTSDWILWTVDCQLKEIPNFICNSEKISRSLHSIFENQFFKTTARWQGFVKLQGRRTCQETRFLTPTRRPNGYSNPTCKQKSFTFPRKTDTSHWRSQPKAFGTSIKKGSRLASKRPARKVTWRNRCVCKGVLTGYPSIYPLLLPVVTAFFCLNGRK